MFVWFGRDQGVPLPGGSVAIFNCVCSGVLVGAESWFFSVVLDSGTSLDGLVSPPNTWPAPRNTSRRVSLKYVSL